MRYADITECEICNGRGVGITYWCQGCPIHCPNCFNKSTWDINGGKEFDQATHDKFMQLVARPYIDRVSILGGEPLCKENAEDVYKLVQDIRREFPEKKIWIYTGYTWESLTGFSKQAAENADVVVDGAFKQELQDFRLAFRGSSNQRLINVPETLKNGKIITLDL